MVSRAARVGPNRFPPGAVAAQVPSRLQEPVPRRQPRAAPPRPAHPVDPPPLEHPSPGVGDVCIALPMAAALSAAAVQGVDPRIRRTAQTLGASAWRTAWAVAREARFALAAVITAAFGHVIAEIGSAMMVGGNIRGSTRTLTTAIALYTGQGDFGLALALGVILLVLALLVNIALQVLQGQGHA